MLNAQLSYDPIWLWESLSMCDTASVAQFAQVSLVGTLVGTKVM